ncbi:UBA/TS-N domain-containing protein [Pestalotiopsis sp. NC0098]|nr:UBA/TS-N domain-containing protein [Pestalotiopsis sp. NC0098]
MSVETGAEAGPNLNLSPDEKRVFGQLFRQADTDNVGVVTGEVAVKFFEKTRLDSRILGEIWQLADRENRGFLTPAGFSIVLRLIGHAQAGREPTYELALQPGPVPRFEGFNPTPAAAPPTPQPLQAQGTGGVPIRIPPLTPEKVSQYAGLFERQNLLPGNLLPGDQARVIFEKSSLANETLGRIWQLADTEQRGALVLTEFVIAMHLLTSLKTGQLRGLPNVLPAGLYEAATRRGSMSRQSPTTTGPPLSAIPRQLSGQAPLRQASPLGRAPLSAQATGLQPQTTGSDWAISSADKARFDQFYADLDKTNKGFITGEEAVPFLSQSGLSEDALAQVWDLADINSQGHLTRDTFAVAMYLIRQQRTRRDGSTALPSSLPANLIPPSLRIQSRPATAVASPFDAPAPEPPRPQPPPAPKSAIDDLFGLDAPAAPALAPMATGGSAAKDPFANASPPFIPSSSFGRTLQTHDTGGSAASKPSAVDDLLGDNDPEISSKLTNETTELANLSNQINSLSNEMQTVQGQRATTQREVGQTGQQKKNFEDRLAQLRALYEKEAKEVADLKDQLQKSRSETQKLMMEMGTLDGNYREIQTQHQQLVAALQADQQENQSLKQKIAAVNAEVAQLKPQIEKLKSDARQQKGMVAINKKQLSTVEGDRDKLKTEAEDLTRSNEESSRQMNTSSPPPTAPAQVASPTGSTASGNNPFFKRTGSTDMMGAFASPAVKSYNDKSFDDIFGGFGGSTSTPPPMTSFKAQNTGASTASASPPLSRAGDNGIPVTGSLAPAPLEATTTGNSAVSGHDVSRAAAPAEDEVPGSAASNGTIPGAFPEDTPRAEAGAATPSFAGNRDSEIFEGLKKDPLNAKDDFDSAFASFGSSSKPQDKPQDAGNAFGGGGFASEFPPISELQHDDDSDSDSEGNGFDDDFAPSSPPVKAEGKETPKAPSSPVATSKSAAIPNVPAAEGAATANQPST